MAGMPVPFQAASLRSIATRGRRGPGCRWKNAGQRDGLRWRQRRLRTAWAPKRHQRLPAPLGALADSGVAAGSTGMSRSLWELGEASALGHQYGTPVPHCQAPPGTDYPLPPRPTAGCGKALLQQVAGRRSRPQALRQSAAQAQGERRGARPALTSPPPGAPGTTPLPGPPTRAGPRRPRGTPKPGPALAPYGSWQGTAAGV